MRKLFALVLLLVASYAAGQNNYFVSPTGNDANTAVQAQSSSTPWRTVQHCVDSFTLSASGAVCHVAAGTYSDLHSGACPGGTNVCVTRGGSSTTVRLVIKCDTTWQCLLRTGTYSGFYVTGVDNVDVVGFDVSGANYYAGLVFKTSGGHAHSLHVLSNYFHDIAQNKNDGEGPGCPAFGAITGGSFGDPPTPATGLHIIGNRVNNYGTITTTTCNEAQGIYIDSLAVSDGLLVENNIVSGSASEGIQGPYPDDCGGSVSNNTVFHNRTVGILFGDDSRRTCSTPGSMTITNNISVNNGHYGFRCYQAADSVGHGNLISNNLASGNTNGDIDATGCPNSTIQNWVHESPSSTFVAYLDSGLGDYHLKSGSLANGSGTTACVGASPCTPTTDFDGNARTNPLSIGAFQTATGGGGGTGSVNQYYVATTGSDSDTGAFGHPWRTISHAIASFGLASSGAVIHVLDGTYSGAITINRGGSSSVVRLVLQCDSGISNAWVAKNKCLLPGQGSGASTILYINGANNVDVVGFDIGNNAAMSAAVVAASCGSAPSASTCSNSVHLIGNYIHDVGASVGGGCPGNGMLDLGNAHGVYISGLQVLRNVLLNFGHGSSNSLTCNTAQGMEIVGKGQVLENNIIINVPVFGLLAYCNGVVSNNVLIKTRGIGIGSAVSADNSVCPSGYGSNSINNNYVSATDTIGNATFWDVVKNDQGVNDCTAGTPNSFRNNFSDGGVPDFDPSTFPGCDTISPASLTHVAGSSFFVDYQLDGSGDYHLHTGSSGIGGGSSQCSTGAGATSPCVPSTDFEVVVRTAADVGAYQHGGTGTPPTIPTGVNVVVHLP